MTDEQRQRLSALQDGELDPASTSLLLDALTRDPSLRATWERYHLIGYAIRGEHVDLACRGIADEVRRAVATQPTSLVPRRRGLRTGSRWVVPMAGVALAASLTFVAIIVAPPLLDGHSPFRTASIQSERFAHQAPMAAQVSRRWHLDRPDLASKLDLFLLTHQETAPAASSKGLLPYAVVVGYDTAR